MTMRREKDGFSGNQAITLTTSTVSGLNRPLDSLCVVVSGIRVLL
jgi:hypothetical protein